MGLTRRIKKLTTKTVSKVTGRHVLVCKVCDKVYTEVCGDVVAITCAYCVQKLVAAPAGLQPKEKSDKPRGWQLKRYFEHNGLVYSKGKLITDTDKITELQQPSVSKSTSVNVISKKRGRPRKNTNKENDRITK